MKFFILTLLLPLNLMAISVSDVCKNVAAKSVGEALRCNEIISADHYFDSSAVFGCHKMSHWTAKGAVDCVEVIANKIYPNQSAKTCVELAGYHSKAVECFERSGKPYDAAPSPCRNNDSVLAKLHSAKSLLINRQYQSAYHKITQAEDELLNCSVE